ncbi:MAG: ATP-binding protein [Candidatus Micrarchaeota archaeon]
MDIDNIKKVILKYRELLPQQIFVRDLQVYETDLKKANVIIGPRRAGKTFYLYYLISKSKDKDWVLVNFEDHLLTELTNADLIKILELSKELFSKEKLIFFFDEIQVVSGWENFIVSLLNEGYKVTVTGSNSKLLSREIATSLRGKALPYLLLPFSFSEYLKYKGITLGKNFELTDQVFEIKKHFEEYTKYGGFPEIATTDVLELKNKIINNYFDSVLYKDIVERLKIKNIKLVEITIKYMLNLFGNTFSVSAFENYLKSNKIPYSLEDLYLILKSLEDVFMIAYVKQSSKSFKKSELSKSKVYLFDTGYIHFLSKESEDQGRILENVVFLELFRRQNEIENKGINYYKSKNEEECDFIVSKKGKAELAIQVCYKLDEKNIDREFKGLNNAMNELNIENGIILTKDQYTKDVPLGKWADYKKIKIMPVWKWILEK